MNPSHCLRWRKNGIALIPGINYNGEYILLLKILINISLCYEMKHYLEKKESGIHISVCLEVLNLGDQNYKLRISQKTGRQSPLSNSVTCPTKLASNGSEKFEIATSSQSQRGCSFFAQITFKCDEKYLQCCFCVFVTRCPKQPLSVSHTLPTSLLLK